jgi:hypothetical protein
MSDDEWFVLIVSAAISTLFWGRWLYVAIQASPLVRPFLRLSILVLCLVGCLSLIFRTLLTAADPVVRDNFGYIILFLAVGGVALAISTTAGVLIGINAVDDAVRTPNWAAVWAVCGLWIGTALVVAGSNVGRGDTIYTTTGPLALGVATLIALWAVFAAIAGTSSVTLDRDSPSGVRLAGLFVAWGVILGRATAGDWESVARTWHDFAVQGWPAAALLVVAIPAELMLRPSVGRPSPPWLAGSGPALMYVLAAVGWVTWLGRP